MESIAELAELSFSSPNRRLKRGCYGQYTKEQMLAAIHSFQFGLMGLNAAAKMFNIPRATLRRKVEGLPVLASGGVPPQPGANTSDATPPPQPSASVGRPPMQPKQVDIKREQLSPCERPSTYPQPQMPPMPTPPAHQQNPLPTPPAHHQQPRPRQSLPTQMRPPSPVVPQQPPAPPPEVCLRWNSYHSNMQATFPSLLNNEQFVDVTLACEGHSIKCHKVMLSACSSYFEELLSQNPCQHPIVLMKDLRFWEVQALVDFMYRGEVNVTQDKLPSLLAAAEALQIKGLAGPAPNSHDADSPMSRGAYDELDPSHPLHILNRRRKRRMPDPAAMLPVRNPVGRPRIHQPKHAARTPTAVPPAVMTQRIQVRPEQQLQRPMPMDEGPPARRMKPSSPASPVGVGVKIEHLETDLSNDSMDKMRYMDRDGGDSGGSGDGSNHGDSLVDLSQDTAERYTINNGLKPNQNRDHSDDQENDQDDDRQLDDDDRDPDHDMERGREPERGQLRDQVLDHDQDQDDDQDIEQDQDHDNDQDRDNDQDMGASDDDQDIHSSDEDQYDPEPPQDSRQHQGENLAVDRLLGRL